MDVEVTFAVPIHAQDCSNTRNLADFCVYAIKVFPSACGVPLEMVSAQC